MIKFRLYYDKDKETQWLNTLAKEGYALKSFFAGFYNFEACEPGKYEYQIDFSDSLFSVSQDYRDFMTEMNIQIVQCWGFWVVLCKEADEEPFQLYTDIDSMIEHYTKIRNMFKVVTIVELICFVMELCAAMNGFAAGAVFTIIIGLLVITLMRATLNTNRTIIELRERKGEVLKGAAAIGKDVPVTGKVSPFLIIGLLSNSIPLALERFGVNSAICSIFQIATVVLLMIGIYQSRHIFGK